MFCINTDSGNGFVLPENAILLTLPKDIVASLRPQRYNDRPNYSCVIVERMVGLIQIHYNDGIMSAMAPVSRWFAQPFVQAEIKENIKAPRHWPLLGEFTGDL